MMSEIAAVLKTKDLRVTFSVRRGGRRVTVRAVRGIDIELKRGETLGLVGESGSGKSTLARALLKLIPFEGKLELDGIDVSEMSASSFRKERRRIQMVFQDPYSSLNPSMTVGESIAEPLKVHTQMNSIERMQRVAEVLELVGLDQDFANRYPDEFSGGQRQRLAIARSIILEPDVLVCDEAVSALDVSTQNQIINLLEDLKKRVGLSYLFISHDLAVVRHISDRIAVMYLGDVVEEGPVDRVYDAAAHPYTQVLLNAVPVPDPVIQRSRAIVPLEGDIPDPTNPPSGCAFSSRCPMAMPICHSTKPLLFQVPSGGSVRCHIHTEGLKLGGKPVRGLQPDSTLEHAKSVKKK
jgi:oligopeptide/dipeptide ABC transporter ATP-binding protein